MAILAACEHLRDRFLLRCWPRPGFGWVRRSGCGMPTSSRASARCTSSPGPATRTGRGRSCARPRWCRSRCRWCGLYSEYMHVEYGGIDSDYVFVNLFGGRVGAAMTYPAVHQLIGRIAARTGIGFTAHVLRHSHATDMVRRGVPIEVVARLLTHRSSMTTSQVYVHLGAADIREALTRAGVWHEEEAR